MIYTGMLAFGRVKMHKLSELNSISLDEVSIAQKPFLFTCILECNHFW